MGLDSRARAGTIRSEPDSPRSDRAHPANAWKGKRRRLTALPACSEGPRSATTVCGIHSGEELPTVACHRHSRYQRSRQSPWHFAQAATNSPTCSATRRSCHLASPESRPDRIRLLANPLSERIPSEVISMTAHLSVARIDGVRTVQPGRRSQARTARNFLHVVRGLPCLVRTIKCELTILLRTDAS